MVKTNINCKFYFRSAMDDAKHDIPKNAVVNRGIARLSGLVFLIK